MKDPAPTNSLSLGRLFDVSDESLTDQIREGSGKQPAHQPVAELLARHWEPVFEYAGLCTVSAPAAGMLTTGAFTRMFADAVRQTGPTAAWRPQLLVMVRRIAGEWDTGRRRPLLHPELRSGASGRDRNAVRLPPPENRRLLFRAFHRLPEPDRCLLWHTAVEAEPMETPAGLLALDADVTRVELERARELIRERCLEAHLELARDEECRGYSRLLDVSVRRGGTVVDRDLRRHMAKCDHCLYAAEQLDLSGDRLAELLAEAVLGWGARAYLDSRPGRRAGDLSPSVAALVPAAGPSGGAGEGAGASAGPRRLARAHARTSLPTALYRKIPRSPRTRHLALAGLALTGCAVFGLAVLSGPWSSLGGGDTALPSVAVETGSGATTPQVGTSTLPPGALSGRLRNSVTGLCVDVRGGKPALHVETVTAACTSSASQLWSYERDGLLRNLARPALCLDSRRSYTIELGRCASAGTKPEDNRYDVTVQGGLVPRWDHELAVVSVSGEAGAALVLKPRDGTESQRWLIDEAGNSPEYQSVAVEEATDEADALVPVAVTLPPPSGTPSAEAASSPSSTEPAPRPTAPGTESPAPTASYGYPTEWPCYYGCSSSGGYGSGYSSGYSSGYGGGYSGWGGW